jgi:hypothetical protein
MGRLLQYHPVTVINSTLFQGIRRMEGDLTTHLHLRLMPRILNDGYPALG